MKDIKLLTIALFIFLALPLLTRQAMPPRYPTQLQPKRLVACSAMIIPFIWTVHYHCEGEGYGGGGGGIF